MYSRPADRSTTAVLIIGILTGLTLWGMSSSARGDDQADPVGQGAVETEIRIDQLIEQLGSPEFPLRERARSQLARLGLIAFDALHQAAQSHPDLEVRMQAQYLVKAVPVDWTREDDPSEVKELLRNYQSQSLTERETLMQRLARLEAAQGIDALCRLVRFETSEFLSKRAALLIIQQPLPEPARRAPWSERILQVTGTSQRVGVKWLRLYAQYLTDPEKTIPAWDELAATEEEALRLRPDKAQALLVRDLLRWQATMLTDLGRTQAAQALIMRSIALQEGTRAELLETMDWLAQHDAWAIVQKLAEKFPETFDKDAELLYRHAEAMRQLQREEDAEQIAQKALNLTRDDDPLYAVRMGYTLQSRGLLDWAEREYRKQIEAAPADQAHADYAALHARLLLADMKHDQGQHLQVVEALEPIVAYMDKHPQTVQLIRRIKRDPNGDNVLRGQTHFSQALHHGEQKQYDQQREHLQQAIQFDAQNADVLIAMYRLPEQDEDWQQSTRKRIDSLTHAFERQIDQFDREHRVARTPSDRANAQRRLAAALNQYAWLVSNTVGDYEAALASSQRSLELRPDSAGYLDTLARCYYALQDHDQALKHQRRAVELEPHSGQIRRQLELFEQTVREND